MSWTENGSSLNIFIVDMALSCYLREVYLMGNLQRFNMKKTSVKLKYYVKKLVSKTSSSISALLQVLIFRDLL